MKSKFGLFLMTEKGYVSLKYLLDNNLHLNIGFICIGRDNAVQNDFSSEIENLCRCHKLAYYYNSDYNTIDRMDYYIAISWRWMLELDNLIVFHDSLLPKYRGFAPLVNSLINGEKLIGVTALYASAEYDKGNIIEQQKIEITYPVKISEAITKISLLYGKLLYSLIEKINSGVTLYGTPQNESDASYSLWLDEDDYFIDWSKSATSIKRKVDACGFPFLFAKTYCQSKVINIVEANTFPDVYVVNREVGKVIFFNEHNPIVVCGDGLLEITEAHYNENKESIFPLKKFRIKFK